MTYQILGAGLSGGGGCLCDIQADGTVVPFLRRYSVDDFNIVTVFDTLIDGVTPYIVTGTPECGPCASRHLTQDDVLLSGSNISFPNDTINSISILADANITSFDINGVTFPGSFSRSVSGDPGKNNLSIQTIDNIIGAGQVIITTSRYI